MTTFVTSDLHFGHEQEFLYVPRGFSSVEEHDEAIIKRWNEVITPEDTVWVLGDLMLGNNELGLQKLKRLNGHLNIVRGNHDSETRMSLYQTLDNVDSIQEGKFLRYKKYNFYLSHYPSITGNYDSDKSLKTRVISLCGHSHTSDAFSDWGNGLIFHAELDTHDCVPWNLDDIIKLLREKYEEERYYQ